MKFVSGNIIEIDRELSELDLFTLEFVRILRKYSPYVIISGYVSILLGRSRVSEDVDVIIPKIDPVQFGALFADLNGHGFYCLNAESERSVFEYLKERFAVRFAKEKQVIPNIELKFAKNRFDDLALARKITVKLGKEELTISHLELQVAFKEVVLKSDKDLEDAKHIRNVAKGHLDAGLIKEYARSLRDFH